jgi:CRP-like cAMP-binding protein
MAIALKERDSDSTESKSLAFFKSLTLFINLRDEEVMCFADAAQIKSYKKGQFLYRESEQATFFHVICSGWLKLFHTTAEGEEMILAMLTKDNITGVKPLFEEEHFTMSAQVVEDAEILNIPLALLKERIRVDNRLALNMLPDALSIRVSQ